MKYRIFFLSSLAILLSCAAINAEMNPTQPTPKPEDETSETVGDAEEQEGAPEMAKPEAPAAGPAVAKPAMPPKIFFTVAGEGKVQKMWLTRNTRLVTVLEALQKHHPKMKVIAVSAPGHAGWIHLTERAKDQALANETFVKAFHRKFGVPMKMNQHFTLVTDFTKPVIRKGGAPRTKPPAK